MVGAPGGVGRVEDTLMKLAMMIVLLAAGTVSEVDAPEEAFTRVAFPEEPAPSCSSGGSLLVAAHHDRQDTAGAFAQRNLAAWFEGTGSDLLLVLGADGRALWVLEAYIASDACDTFDCARVVLREVGFDGTRRAHELSDRTALESDDIPMEDLIDKRLQAWQILSGGAVTPVHHQVNHQQDAAGAAGISTWAVRVRDSIHRKSFVWRRHMTPFMCWCKTRYEVSTYDWSAENS